MLLSVVLLLLFHCIEGQPTQTITNGNCMQNFHNQVTFLKQLYVDLHYTSENKTKNLEIDNINLLKRIQRLNESYEQEKLTLEEFAASVNDRNMNLDAKIQTLNNKCDEESWKVEELERILASVIDENTNLKAMIQTLNEKYEDEQLKKQQLEGSFMSLEDKNMNLQEQMQSLNESYEQEILALEEFGVSVNDQIMNLNKQIQNVNDKYERGRLQREAIEARVTSMEEQNKPFKTVRLSRGTYGILEVYYRERDEWGTVCDDQFDANNVECSVVCRQLGYRYGIHIECGEGTGNILLDDVHCVGSEASIQDCPHSPWLSHNCGHSEDAGCRCCDNNDSCDGNVSC